MGERKCKRHFSKPPILIGGCGRSGTTLLLAILSAHPDIFAIPYETDAFTSWCESPQGLIPERIDRFHRALLTNKVHANNIRWCEKRPANVKYIKEILNYFGPEAKFIHIVRDPRAVCTSLHPHDTNKFWVPIDRYIEDVTSGKDFELHPQVYTLKYEELISNFNQEVNSLSLFLNLPLSKELSKWFEYATVRKNPAWNGSLQQIHNKSLSTWKEEKLSDRISEITSNLTIQSLMRHFGYD